MYNHRWMDRLIDTVTPVGRSVKTCQREPHDPDRFTPPSHPGSEYLSHLVTHKTIWGLNKNQHTFGIFWIFPQEIPTVTASTVYPEFQGIEKLLCSLPQIHPVDVTMWSCTTAVGLGSLGTCRATQKRGEDS